MIFATTIKAFDRVRQIPAIVSIINLTTIGIPVKKHSAA